jgi:acetyl esterase/lipase
MLAMMSIRRIDRAQERLLADTAFDPITLVAPELRDGLAMIPELDISEAALPAIRQGFIMRELPPLPEALQAVACEERFLPGWHGAPDVRVLHYTPPGVREGLRPALLNIHGGGYVLGNAEINDPPNRMAALKLGCVVVSVDYRLAPETRWPGALEDCYAALCWLHDNAAELGIDPARIAISGESAGGGHAASLALYARDRIRRDGAGPAICFQLIDYPMLDDRTCVDPQPHPYCGHFIWTPDKNHLGWQALLGVAPGGPDVPDAAVPARAEDLSSLPPAYISIGSLDLFLEESLEYARRLTRAGVPVELHVTPGGYHGFGIAQGSPQVVQANALRLAALKRAFA